MELPIFYIQQTLSIRLLLDQDSYIVLYAVYSYARWACHRGGTEEGPHLLQNCSTLVILNHLSIKIPVVIVADL